MHEKDYILSAIKREAKNYLKEPDCGFSKERFREWSYRKWAIKDILKRIESSSFSPPIMIVEDYISKMNDYSCRNAKSSRVFAVAYDTAVWIMDILLSIK